MPDVQRENLPLESKVGLIIDGVFQMDSPGLVEPMMINLSGEDRYYATLVNLTTINDPGFGEFILEYAKETSRSLNADKTIVLFPAVLNSLECGKKTLSVVNDIDFSQKEHNNPYLVALIDDGESLSVDVYSIAGLPGTCLFSTYVNDLGAKPEFFNSLLELWGIDDELKPGILNDRPERFRPDEDFDLSWYSISDLIPTIH